MSIATFLDESDNVVSYQYEGYRIAHDDNGKMKNFMNDFTVKLLNSKIVILEVKPIGLIKYCIQRLYAQFCYAMSNNYEFRIITGNTVKNLNILDVLLRDIINGKTLTTFDGCRS